LTGHTKRAIIATLRRFRLQPGHAPSVPGLFHVNMAQRFVLSRPAPRLVWQALDTGWSRYMAAMSQGNTKLARALLDEYFDEIDVLADELYPETRER
jgi:hypothetical protein